MAKSTVAVPGQWVTQRKRNGEVGTFWRPEHTITRGRDDASAPPCGYCGFVSTTDLGRRNHINRVHKDRLGFACPHCEMRFDTPRARQTHLGFKHKADGFIRNRNRPEVQREWNLRKSYGIGLAEYEAMLVFQGGRCGVCRATSADSVNRHLHVDHDHETGAIRGLLCSHCNRALGNVRDDPQRLRALADYLDLGGLI